MFVVGSRLPTRAVSRGRDRRRDLNSGRLFASIRAINAVMLQTGNYVWIGPSHGNIPNIYIYCLNYQPSLLAHTHGNGKSADSFSSVIIFSEIRCNHIASSHLISSGTNVCCWETI